jgi:hypothetical protein
MAAWFEIIDAWVRLQAPSLSMIRDMLSGGFMGDSQDLTAL